MFKPILNNGIFWLVFILEMAITHLMLFVGESDLGTKVLGVTTLNVVEYSICWVLAILSIPLFIVTQLKLPLKPFETLVQKLDLEIDDAPGAEYMARMQLLVSTANFSNVENEKDNYDGETPAED